MWTKITKFFDYAYFFVIILNMADYMFIRKSRNALSSFLHVILNLALSVVSIGATVITGNCLIGLVLVVISKWRIFAVNHRYWLVNIRASLVDIIVGTSFVLLAYAAGTEFLPVHYALILGYAIWLILIKPRSSTNFTIIQAIAAILLGGTTATIFAAISDSVVLVLASFLLGYAAIHHVLIQSDDQDSTLISLTAGLVFAEIGWLCHSWLIIYTIGTTGICLSQTALILSVLAFTFFKIHAAILEKGDKMRFADVALPILFSLLVIIVLVVGFSQPRFNIH